MRAANQTRPACSSHRLNYTAVSFLVSTFFVGSFVLTWANCHQPCPRFARNPSSLQDCGLSQRPGESPQSCRLDGFLAKRGGCLEAVWPRTAWPQCRNDCLSARCGLDFRLCLASDELPRVKKLRTGFRRIVPDLVRGRCWINSPTPFTGMVPF